MPTPILILASDTTLRDGLRRAAEEFGRVVTTSKPAMAIYLTAVHEPLIAIVDLDAVPPDGRFGLVSTLHTRFRVAVVGIGDAATLRDAAGISLATTILKPIHLSDVMHVVDRLLDGRLGESAESHER
ncbi:MAG TPA: hypothetical protein VNL16_04435 [Chloroflexota bacterium]|nr:hypothetical protein [Chloroflexota bacterium]